MNRVGFIGGSDCVKIMQGDWLELWKIKTGREQQPTYHAILQYKWAYTQKTLT